MTTTTLYLSNGQPLQLKKGLPPGYNNICIRGARVFHAASRFGLVVIQYISVNGLIFECLYIKWNVPETIFCTHEYPGPVLSTRIITRHPLQETLKGAGRNDFRTNQFASVTGVNWTSLLTGPEACENISYRAVWPAELIVNELNGHEELLESIENPMPLVPDPVPGPLFKVDDAMLELMSELINTDYSRPRSWVGFIEKMMELFALVKKESIERAPVKTSEDGQKIMAAIGWIKKDPYRKITTQELAQKVFTNEYKLKIRFKEITGCSIDKFRQHLVLIDVRNKLLTRRMPASLLFKKAGYSDLPALSHSMKLHLSCGLGELKSKKWNFDCNNKNIGSE